MKEIAGEMAGRAIVGKIYPSDPELFKKFRVRPIPAFFIVRDGEVKKSFLGTRSKDILMKVLERHGP